MAALSIAFFVEPMPIRGNLEYGRLPFDIVRIAADAIAVASLANTYVVAKDYFIEGCEGAFQRIPASVFGFEQGDDGDWELGWLKSAANVDLAIAEKVKHFLKLNAIDVIFIVDKHETIRHAAMEVGVKIVHIAQGPIRSTSSRYWLFDPDGVGPDSLLNHSLTGNHSPPVPRQASAQGLQVLLDSVVPVLSRQVQNKERVLIALQPDDDFSGLVWNIALKSSRIIQLAQTASENFPEIEFTIRRHPSDAKDYSHFFAVGMPNLRYDDGGTDIWASLGKYSAVINVCSSIATEARLAGLKVLTLGRSLMSNGCDPNYIDASVTEFLMNLSSQTIADQAEIEKISYAIDHFLVEEAIAQLPTIYFILAKELLRVTDARKWFKDGNLRAVCHSLGLGAVRSDIGRLKTENFYRSRELGALSYSADHDRNNISQLLTHNHLRMVEIEQLQNEIRLLQNDIDSIKKSRKRKTRAE